MSIGTPTEIRGTVWNDSDGDGLKDVDELTLSGWTVYLTYWFPDGEYTLSVTYDRARVWEGTATLAGEVPAAPTIVTPGASLILNSLTPQLVWHQWRLTDDDAHGVWLTIINADTEETVWNTWVGDNQTAATVPAGVLTDRGHYVESRLGEKLG